MKRTLLAGTFSLLAGAATLLLAASIIYSCRSGGDPHNERSSRSHDAPTNEVHADLALHREPDGRRLTPAHSLSPTHAPSAPASTG